MQHIALLDANSLGFAAHNGTVLTVGEQQVQAIFGVLRSVRALRVEYPAFKPIVLWDGKAQWRYDLYPGYKDRTGKNAKSDEAREAYKLQRPAIAKGLRLLGVSQMLHPLSEADDLAAQLSKTLSIAGNKVLLVTGDKDWMQLIDENVMWHEHRSERARTVTLNEFMDETGCSNVRQFVEMKALTGDTSDTIPGVGGIGEKGAAEFLAKYGSVQEFYDLVDSGLSDVKLGAVLQRFANNEAPKPSKKHGEMPPMRDAFRRNMKLMDLSQAPIVTRDEIVVTKGDLDREGFKQFCEEHFFRSILDNLDSWIEPFQRRQ